ncbi:LacI family DNA-binding transcriptional regulator [Motilibacter peucedani]|uniref:LacI family DNA-binding transcriptional regulator n=1 Tax=Motilibacter peucedani TaxID=598650 RepID=UPI001603D962|nr:LacI family DNA-binding transcriptional regulator [Motilibacter peucedani]
MVSIADLSRLSGVSVATVSRALNGYPDVSAATRARIEQLARETGYTPSEAARTLVRGKSSLVGVVWSRTYDDEAPHAFLHEVLDAMRDELARQGYDLLLLSPPSCDSGDRPDTLVRRARQLRLAGVMVMGVEPDDPAVVALAESDVPTVVLDLDLSGPSTRRVTSDNAGGGALAARHLVEIGRTRLAVITGEIALPMARERLEGFLAEAERAGLEVPAERVRSVGFQLGPGKAAMHELLALPEPPDGVFAAGDMAAIGVLLAAAEEGVDVPGQVAVVGYDDVRQAAYVSPPLTTVRQDVTAIGTAAAAEVLALSASPVESTEPLVLPVRLVVRGSTVSA